MKKTVIFLFVLLVILNINMAYRIGLSNKQLSKQMDEWGIALGVSIDDNLNHRDEEWSKVFNDLFEGQARNAQMIGVNTSGIMINEHFNEPHTEKTRGCLKCMNKDVNLSKELQRVVDEEMEYRRLTREKLEKAKQKVLEKKNK